MPEDILPHTEDVMTHPPGSETRLADVIVRLTVVDAHIAPEGRVSGYQHARAHVAGRPAGNVPDRDVVGLRRRELRFQNGLVAHVDEPQARHELFLVDLAGAIRVDHFPERTHGVGLSSERLEYSVGIRLGQILSWTGTGSPESLEAGLEEGG